eukprot:CAMPEP_0174861486 /NCGR_PEP_ID=MMETSP1114-20130205/51760_1 /TAXON_ID=312471 /ORGANISM="Neobodo designis, Strain CCAP 1951/1" /LENGTH=399 /DNA_ID=CAMNT_0016096499 /DNA_START=31 /DNA_END=1226 /DNA_ORIENTATION=-
MTNRRAVGVVVAVALALALTGKILFQVTAEDEPTVPAPLSRPSPFTTPPQRDSSRAENSIGIASLRTAGSLSAVTAQSPPVGLAVAPTLAPASPQRLVDGQPQCLESGRDCARAWASHVEPPADEARAVFKFRDGNPCGYGKGDLLAMTKELLRTHQLQMHGDSTLREMIKVLIKFVGVNGNLEKKDANKNQREARYFDEDLANIGGRVRMAYRFDHLPANVNEPFLTLPDTFRGAPRVDVVCMGVHMADHELVDLKSPYEDAVARMPAAVIGNFTAYLTAINRDPSVTAVVVLLQDLECEQMGRAVLEQFRKRAPYCPNIARFVERYNGVFLDFLRREPELARKVVVMGPFNCAELKPRGSKCKGGVGACACTKDGIHLRTRYLKLRVEAFIHTLARA